MTALKEKLYPLFLRPADESLSQDDTGRVLRHRFPEEDISYFNRGVRWHREVIMENPLPHHL